MRIVNAKDRNMEKIFKSLDALRVKKGPRYAIENIYYDSKRKNLVATNGKVMISYKVDDPETLEALGDEIGYFQLQGKILMEIEKPAAMFPEYWRIIPDFTKMKSAALSEYSIGGISAKAKPHQVMNALSLITGKIFSMEQAPFLAGLDLDTCYHAPDKKLSAVAVVGGNIVVMIQPFYK